jgi:hypothetical protein
VLFGGFDGKSQLDDLHVLNLHRSTWSQPVLSGVPLLPRNNHTVRGCSAAAVAVCWPSPRQ